MEEYKQHVMKTAVRIHSEDRLLCSAFGLCGESGEIVDLVKKSFFHGNPFEKDALLRELGDVLWYLELASICLEIAIDDEKELHLKDFKVDSNILLKLSLKLCKRASWCADHISDYQFDKKEINTFEIKKRLSDIYICIHYFAIALNSSIAEIKEKNVEKLKKRFPEVYKA